SMDAIEAPAIYQAIARRIGSAALVHDIPFRATANRIGVILPERDYDRLYADAEAIVIAMQSAAYLNRQGQSEPVGRYANLKFGLGTYQGEDGTIDLMRAAVDSLNISRDLAEIGDARLSAYAMPATPIELSGPVVSTEEE
ncbi:MAG: hypothetical protein M3R61_12595, partial [Chloroflexota bacterium]|nr:hypothetical protein [Chloroflexota bacterium]